MNLKRLAEFIHARLDEDDRAANDLVGPAAADRRPFAEAEAKRCALALWEDTLRMPGYMNDPVQHATEQLLRVNVILPIVAIYSDHEDYDWTRWRNYPSSPDHPSARERRERYARQMLAPPIISSIADDLRGEAP
jgi:hypothetical protein